MDKVKIGIIKEGKVPIDRRVPLTPEQAKYVQEKFNVEVLCQSSEIRCFADDDYEKLGVKVVEDVSDCQILLGVKEVPIPNLLADKTYFFFSHTIKEQPYNRDLLREIVQKNIRLIDYEVLTNEEGNRVIAFGRYAGLVGAYNAILTFGKRYNLYEIKPAHECFDLNELKVELLKVNLPKVKIALTGGGRVAKGAMEVLYALGLRRVTPAAFLEEKFQEAVFTQLNSRDYHRPKDGGEFVRHDFYNHPETYQGDFLKYAQVSDILIAGAFWDPKAPVLFEREDIIKEDFKIKVVADITCDIEGSIPSTKKASTIEDPVYDYNPSEDTVESAYVDEGNITVMAVDNLPCELPRDASHDFGQELVDNVLPNLLGPDDQGMIKRATITENGGLTVYFMYLENYLNGKLYGFKG